MNLDKYEIVLPQEGLKDHYTTGLVINTHNRPCYLSYFFSALKKSKLNDLIIMLVDDASSCKATLDLIHNFEIKNVPIIKAFRRQDDGFCVHESLELGWNYLHTNFKCNYYTNIDSDTLMLADWLETLKKKYIQIKLIHKKPFILSGFNTDKHPVREYFKGYVVKDSAGGINFFFDSFILKNIINPLVLYWDDSTVARMKIKGYDFICLSPSVIEHIGFSGRFSTIRYGADRSCDFPFYKLYPNKLIAYYHYVRIKYFSYRLAVHKYFIAS